MSESNNKYKGARIEIDLDLKRYKREMDNNWMSLPKPKLIVLNQRKMHQRAGMIGANSLHKFNAFAVYLKAGNLNILVYHGRRDKVESEAKKLSDFLNLKIVDLFPRDEEGHVIDDDYKDSNNSMLYIAILVVIFLLIVLVIS